MEATCRTSRRNLGADAFHLGRYAGSNAGAGGRHLAGCRVREVESVSREPLGLAEDELVFLFMFNMCSDFQRESPHAVVRAFQRAFASIEKATLVSRSAAERPTRKPGAIAEAVGKSKVVLIDEVVSCAKVFWSHRQVGLRRIAAPVERFRLAHGGGDAVRKARFISRQVLG